MLPAVAACNLSKGAATERECQALCGSSLSAENALLHTFSTIAQALGGADGLIVVFALYRLQGLEAVALKAMSAMRQISTKDADLARAEADADYPKFLQRFKVLAPETGPKFVRAEASAYYPMLVLADRASRSLRNSLRIGLVATGIVMVLSVGTLTSTPWLKQDFKLSVFFLAVGAIAFAYCMYRLFSVAYAIVSMPVNGREHD